MPRRRTKAELVARRLRDKTDAAIGRKSPRVAWLMRLVDTDTFYRGLLRRDVRDPDTGTISTVGEDLRIAREEDSAFVRGWENEDYKHPIPASVNGRCGRVAEVRHIARFGRQRIVVR